MNFRRTIWLWLLLCLVVAGAQPAAAWDEAYATHRQRWQQAQAAWAARQTDQARVIWAELAAGDWPLADWAAVKLVALYDEAGDEAQRQAWQRFIIERFPQSHFRPALMLDLATGHLEHRPDAAIPVLQAYLQDYPDRDETRAQFLLGQALALVDRRQEAAVAYGQAAWWGIDEYATKAQAALRALNAAGLRAAPPSADAMWDKIKENIAQRKWYTAGVLADRYAEIYRGTARAFYASLLAVDSLAARRKRDEAQARLKTLNRLAGSADERLAVAVRDIRLNKKVSTEKKREFCGTAAAHPAGWLSRLYARQAMLALDWDDDRFSSAAEWADRLLAESAGDLMLPDEVAWQAAFGRYLAGDHAGAAERLRKWVAAYPAHKDIDRAQYWLGRALEQVGDRQAAQAAYRPCFDRWQGTYYGMAAESRLLALGVPRAQLPVLPFVNRSGNPAGVMTLPAAWEQTGGGGTEFEPGAKAALDAAASANGAPYASVFRAVREYLALRENSEAQALLNFARDRGCRTGEGPYLLSVAFALAGDNLASINAANRAFEQLRDGRVNDPQGLTLRRRFPILYRDLVFTTAQRHGLDPYLVLGVIKQESGFQLEATSSAGARGLMQVMPGTGRTIARKRGLRGFHTAQLYKPETSLDFGCWFLADLRRKLGGEIPAALAGYNAGLGRPQQWWPRYAGRDHDALIELIPFDETEGYVKAILRNYEMYQRLYLPATTSAAARENLFDRLARPVSALP